MDNPFVFQTDSNIVNDTYCNSLNFLVEYDESCTERDTCVIYFSSNDIYYPNTENAFRHRIIERNSFEWYRIRVTSAYKHIFVRDIFKQWYLSGINVSINSPQSLFDFLKDQTTGYSHITTIGSSAGGYAAILFGIQLRAEKILAFDAQLELETLLLDSSEKINPIIFRQANTQLRFFFNLKNIVNLNSNRIFYFYSNKSSLDERMYNYIINNGYNKINVLSFSTAHHGIPFPKVALLKVINMDNEKLMRFKFKVNNPLIFTIKLVGICKTIIGLYKQIYSLRKKH